MENRNSSKTEPKSPYAKRTPLETVVPLETPYIINIDVCGACNLTCNFCPCNTVEDNKTERHKIMSLDTFTKIVDDLKEFDDKIKIIHLHCFGEPLLNKNLLKMIKYLKDSNVCEKIMFATNGTLLTKKCTDKLVDSGLDILWISLNGLDEIEYKNTCNFNMNFNVFYDNIKYFYSKSRNKVELQIKATTYYLENESDKNKLHNLFDNYCDRLFVEDIIVDMWSEFDSTETDLSHKLGFHDNKRNKICASPLFKMVIHSNGIVSGCCSDWKFGTAYGDVKQKSVKEIWNSTQLFSLRIYLLKGEKGKLPFCDNCNIRTPDNIDDVADIIINRLEGINL